MRQRTAVLRHVLRALQKLVDGLARTVKGGAGPSRRQPPAAALELDDAVVVPVEPVELVPHMSVPLFHLPFSHTSIGPVQEVPTPPHISPLLLHGSPKFACAQGTPPPVVVLCVLEAVLPVVVVVILAPPAPPVPLLPPQATAAVTIANPDATR